jgi:hypothetical protein
VSLSEYRISVGGALPASDGARDVGDSFANIKLAIMSIDVAECSGFFGGNQRLEKSLPSKRRQSAKDRRVTEW